MDDDDILEALDAVGNSTVALFVPQFWENLNINDPFPLENFYVVDSLGLVFYVGPLFGEDGWAKVDLTGL
jgi:hypothetical protein